jgi:hypothetical protein
MTDVYRVIGAYMSPYSGQGPRLFSHAPAAAGRHDFAGGGLPRGIAAIDHRFLLS